MAQSPPEMQIQDVLSQLEGLARSEYSGTKLTDLLKQGFGPTTVAVKRAFGNLGVHLGYEVGAHGYDDAHVGEWLYDVTWTKHDGGNLVRQVLVLESEWKHGVGVKNNAEVDRDFKKLVQARADVRVWISTSHNEQLAKAHLENCVEQIMKFAHTMPGDVYLFVIHTWSTSSTSVTRFVVP